MHPGVDSVVDGDVRCLDAMEGAVASVWVEMVELISSNLSNGSAVKAFTIAEYSYSIRKIATV